MSPGPPGALALRPARGRCLLSVEAISWALNPAPVPADRDSRPSSACKFVLVDLANHAGPDGTGAFPSVATLVRCTGLSDRTGRTCLDRLETKAITRPCDPDIVAARIKRADRRPKGWDLDLTHRRPGSSPHSPILMITDGEWIPRQPAAERLRASRSAGSDGASCRPVLAGNGVWLWWHGSSISAPARVTKRGRCLWARCASWPAWWPPRSVAASVGARSPAARTSTVSLVPAKCPEHVGYRSGTGAQQRGEYVGCVSEGICAMRSMPACADCNELVTD